MSKLNAEIFEGRHSPGKKLNLRSIQALGVLRLATRGCKKKSRSDDGRRFHAIVEHFGPNRCVSSIEPKEVEVLMVCLQEQTTTRVKNLAAASINHT